MTAVAIINESTVVTDDDVKAFVAAAQIQVSRDVAPAWGADASLVFVPKGSKPNPSAWVLAILDDADQAGALGYHDVTSTGQPLGKCFAKTTMHYGLDWHVTASHELIEMLGDPWINRTMFDQSSAKAGVIYAWELCDAPEDDKYGYLINGLRMSDFVLPAWFEPGSKGPYDHGGHITAPLQLLSGGYIGVYDVTRGHGWSQLTADMVPARGRQGPDGSRRDRRDRKSDGQPMQPSTAV